jgi:anti-sigma factor RsiW
MNEYCSNLDNYLLGDLTPADEAAFAAHLQACNDCREAVDEQQWINNLLEASSQLETEIPPPHIASELRVVAASRESYRNRAVAIAFATAAALLVAVTWLLNHPAGTLPERITTLNQIPNAPEPPHAVFVAGSGAIAVPVESRHPDVTIVRIYSKFQPADDSKMAAFQPESNNLNNPIDFSNGG